MNASESALLQSSLALVRQRFQSIVGDSPSKAWLLHVHDKGDATPPIYALADGYNSPGIESKPSTWARVGCPAIGCGVPRFWRGVRLNGSESLTPISNEAASLLVLLPAAVQSRLWRGLPAGTELREAEGDLLWALAVFELANANVAYSSLRAVRQTPITAETAKAFFAPESKLPADSDWYATLPDFAAASVQAIDILQSWMADALKKEAEANGEPPETVERQSETSRSGNGARAGAAFVKRLEEEPELALAFKAVQAKFRAIGVAARSPEAIAERLAAEEVMNAELAAAGLTPPDSMEGWMKLGRVVGIPRSDIGQETLAAIYDEVMIYSEREKSRAKILAAEMLAQQSQTPPAAPSSDTKPVELLHELTSQQTKIVTHLWNAKHATHWRSLPAECWRDGRSTSDQTDRAIESALERLRDRLNSLPQFGLTLEVHSAKQTTKLLRNPPRK